MYIDCEVNRIMRSLNQTILLLTNSRRVVSTVFPSILHIAVAKVKAKIITLYKIKEQNTCIIVDKVKLFS